MGFTPWLAALKEDTMKKGRVLFNVLLITLLIALPSCSQSEKAKPAKSTNSQSEEAKPAKSTKLYLAFGGDFALQTEPAPVGSAASFFCLSPFDWQAVLAGDIRGTSYSFSLGLANDLGSSAPGKLLAQIILKSAAKETVLAAATFTTSSNPEVKKATVTGNDPEAKDGDLLVVRVTRVEGSPCLYFHSSTYRDQFIQIPETAIRSQTKRE
jgi:hypothetical protein